MKALKRKATAWVAAIAIIGSLSSCYSTTTCVGTQDKDAPMVEVNTVKNHFLLYGLIPVGNTKLQDNKYVGDKKDYRVKKSITFVDGLLNFLTFGIYTPSTTTYYVSLK